MCNVYIRQDRTLTADVREANSRPVLFMEIIYILHVYELINTIILSYSYCEIKVMVFVGKNNHVQFDVN